MSALNAWRREVAAAAVEAQDTAYIRQKAVPVTVSEADLPDYNSTGEPLMTCRYCILYELGHCRKQPSRLKPESEPRYLRLSNGTTVELQFDCKNCRMNILDCSNSQPPKPQTFKPTNI